MCVAQMCARVRTHLVKELQHRRGDLLDLTQDAQKRTQLVRCTNTLAQLDEAEELLARI